MALKLMYITNRPDIASICDAAGVDRIFIDLETVGKAERQSLLDTVKSHHSISDIEKVRNAITNAEILVRINPIYEGSEFEINSVANSSADIVMLPYFTSIKEVETFLRLLGGRKRSCLLFETPWSVENADDVLKLDGIDEVYIGLNDLHLGYKQKFLFQPLADGTVDILCRKFKAAGIPYGFGGVAQPEKGQLKGKYIIGEHKRLNSSTVILSRSFCNYDDLKCIPEAKDIFVNGVREIRECEIHFENSTQEELIDNMNIVKESISKISSLIQ